MKVERILYLGTRSGTCLDRARALTRMGYAVTHLDPRAMLPTTSWVDRFTWKLGGQLFAPVLHRRLQAALAGQHFDVCLVDCGEWVSAPTVHLLRQHASKVINYNIDDPTGPRDGLRFTAYRRAISSYDLAVVMRQSNVDELHALGMRKVLRVFMCSDEVSHAPRPISADDHRTWGSDILFLGTWMPERGPFLLELIKVGLPVSIRGPNWYKAPEWDKLKPYWLGPGIGGDDYARAIQCAKINIGLLSKGNRDLHTTRSMEIPALGGLFCAERTAEHLALYQEGQDAAFWSDARECIAVCTRLLANEPLRRQMMANGQARHLASLHRNERMLSRVMDAAMGAA
ncbi:MAG: glycosyltransferase [Aquabacterium sp.]